jgi:hypothetical protein
MNNPALTRKKKHCGQSGLGETIQWGILLQSGNLGLGKTDHLSEDSGDSLTSAVSPVLSGTAFGSSAPSMLPSA